MFIQWYGIWYELLSIWVKYLRASQIIIVFDKFLQVLLGKRRCEEGKKQKQKQKKLWLSKKMLNKEFTHPEGVCSRHVVWHALCAQRAKRGKAFSLFSLLRSPTKNHFSFKYNFFSHLSSLLQIIKEPRKNYTLRCSKCIANTE